MKSVAYDRLVNVPRPPVWSFDDRENTLRVQKWCRLLSRVLQSDEATFLNIRTLKCRDVDDDGLRELLAMYGMDLGLIPSWIELGARCLGIVQPGTNSDVLKYIQVAANVLDQRFRLGETCSSPQMQKVISGMNVLIHECDEKLSTYPDTNLFVLTEDESSSSSSSEGDDTDETASGSERD